MAMNLAEEKRGPRWQLSIVLAGVAVAFASMAFGATSEEIIARGKYLADLGGCESCHTLPGAAPYSGGGLVDTPFGQVSVPNITSNPASGIGQWTPEEFYRVLHDGIGRSGHYLYPIMPYPSYTIVTRDDALAIQAYLFSLPPVLKHRRQNHLWFPYSVRSSLAEWREHFFKPAGFAPDPQRSAQVNRGDYLVNGLARCSLCHSDSPGAVVDAGAANSRQPFQGGVIRDWWALNLAPEVRSATASWSEADIASFLKTGVAPGATSATPPVAPSVHGLANASDDDLSAIAAYLKETPPPGRAPEMFAGARDPGGQVYLDRCASCHGLDAKGVPEVIPGLAGNATVTAADPADTIKAVLGGRIAAGTYAPMAAVGVAMTDDEVADVVNFVRQGFGNPVAPTVTPGKVAELRGSIDTPMNPALAAACTPIPTGPITIGINQPLSGIPPAIRTVDPNNLWPRLLALADRVERYIPMANFTERTNILTGMYCRVLMRNAALDRLTRTTMLGTFSQQMYNTIRDYPSIVSFDAQ